MAKKKRSAKQKANDARLRARAKAGTLFKTKRRKSAKKRVVRGKRTSAGRGRKSRVKPSKTRRSRGGSASDIDKSLLIDDIARMPLSIKNKLKIIKTISKRLRI